MEKMASIPFNYGDHCEPDDRFETEEELRIVKEDSRQSQTN